MCIGVYFCADGECPRIGKYAVIQTVLGGLNENLGPQKGW